MKIATEGQTATYDHKKQGFTLSLEDTFFEKPQGGGSMTPKLF